MPRKPKRPCSYPGCPLLTDNRYCEEHQKLTDKQYNKYQRNPEHRKRYSRAWQQIRVRYISSHPLCEECCKHNKLTAAAVVHHIIPLSKGGVNDESNLMSLCKACHSTIHAKRGDRWHR